MTLTPGQRVVALDAVGRIVTGTMTSEWFDDETVEWIDFEPDDWTECAFPVRVEGPIRDASEVRARKRGKPTMWDRVAERLCRCWHYSHEHDDCYANPECGCSRFRNRAVGVAYGVAHFRALAEPRRG